MILTAFDQSWVLAVNDVPKQTSPAHPVTRAPTLPAASGDAQDVLDRNRVRRLEAEKESRRTRIV